jgi:hypothetical protein
LRLIVEPAFLVEEEGVSGAIQEISNRLWANESRIKELSQTFNLLSAEPFYPQNGSSKGKMTMKISLGSPQNPSQKFALISCSKPFPLDM